MSPSLADASGPPPRWRIIVPVRGGMAGKTRLTSVEGRPLSESDRADLAFAMASDTVTAAIASGLGPVSVLTGDVGTARRLALLGAMPRSDQRRGLNAEIDVVLRDLPPDDGALVLLGDLPAVTGPDLRAAVVEVGAGEGAYVPDRDGVGTAMVGYAPQTHLRVVAFGADSARRHDELGLTPIGAELTRLRCDVDTSTAWDEAVGLGLGSATAAARERLLGRPSAASP